MVAKIKGVETPILLKAGIASAIWRDLFLITVIQKSEASAPLTFRSHVDALNEGPISFWCGELVKTKGKILDTVESVFTVPFELFKPAGQIRYQQGVTFAEILSKRLLKAVQEYYANQMQRSGPTESAKRHFWNTLDQKSSILLSMLKNLGTDDDPMGSSNFGEIRDPWTVAVRAAADAAYEHTCPRGNPRQYEAYAAGLRVLRPLPKKSKPATRKSAPATSDS